ncbi:MAG: hypothetical protein KAR35_03375, partial [Candidatus Heimdallarchaeota archaeon]|nr:hypothetical protein [Candidatus Heimdallarchaeota archaeon]MCK5048396.1 hypothetical protein [Candidatus Heimdallarchaeota archaeon]
EWYNFTSNPLGEADRNCAFYDNGAENSLVAVNYDFDLPVTAKIFGIEVKVLHAPWNTGYYANLSIELFWNNRESVTSTGYFDYVDGSYHGFDATFKNVTLGASNDDWGRSWAIDDFSNENFGVRLVCTDFIGSETVDIAWVKIYYYEDTTIIIDQIDAITFEYDDVNAYLNWTVYLYNPNLLSMKDYASTEFLINGFKYSFSSVFMNQITNGSMIVINSSSTLYNEEGTSIEFFQDDYQPGEFNVTLFVSWEDLSGVYSLNSSCTIMVTINAPPVTEFSLTGLIFLGIVIIPFIKRKKK